MTAKNSNALAQPEYGPNYPIHNLENPQVLDAVLSGLADVEAGRVYSTEEVFQMLRQEMASWKNNMP